MDGAAALVGNGTFDQLAEVGGDEPRQRCELGVGERQHFHRRSRGIDGVVREIEHARLAQGEVIAVLAPHFERLGDLVMTGPTLTNVNDFRAILVR